MKNILILTADPDPHVVKSVEYLDKKNFSAKILYTNKVKDKYSTQIEFLSNRIVIKDCSNSYNLDSFHSIWYRKPLLWINYNKEGIIEPQRLDEADVLYKKGEWRRICDSTMYLGQESNKFCVSFLKNLYFASDKLTQLTYANSLKFQIPSTLVSSNLESLSHFIKTKKNCIIKRLSSSSVYKDNIAKAFPTQRLTLSKFNKIKSKAIFDHPHFIQEEIKKKAELRITVIGNKIFPCIIDSQAKDESSIDVRNLPPYLLKHEKYKLPKEIEDKCFALVKKLGLQFGAIDMAINKKGEYIFFEINPNGQYLWIEDMTGMPLSEAMANLLMYPEKNAL